MMTKNEDKGRTKNEDKGRTKNEDKGRTKNDDRGRTKNEDRGRTKIEKPLQSRKVFLDIQNKTTVAEITKQIEALGGKVEDFLSKEISLVITNQRCVDRFESVKSVHSPSPLSNASPYAQQQYSNKYSTTPVRSPFSTDSQHHVTDGIKKSKPAVNVSRGKLLTSTVLSSKRGSGAPDVAGKAKQLGAKLISLEGFREKFLRRGSLGKEQKEDVDISLLKKRRTQSATTLRSMRSHHTVPHVQVLKLIEPFFRIEIKSRLYRPIFYEIKKWPKIYSKTARNDCPFELPNERKSKKTPQAAEMERKYIPSVAEKSENDASVKEKVKEEKAKEARGDVRNISYCDCCLVRYQDLNKHIKSEKHRSFARNKENFKDLDKFIAQCTPFEEFLQILKSNIVKQKPKEVEVETNVNLKESTTSNLKKPTTIVKELSINVRDDSLECAINQIDSTIQHNVDVKECNDVLPPAVDSFAIEEHVETNGKTKHKQPYLIEEDKSHNNKENNLADKCDPDHHGNNNLVENRSKINSHNDDILDENPKVLNEIGMEINKLANSKPERSSIKHSNDIPIPTDNDKCTIHGEEIISKCSQYETKANDNLIADTSTQEAHNNSIADTSTEPYAMLGHTVSDAERSMNQLAHFGDQREDSNSNQNIRCLQNVCGKSSMCTLEVKTILETSSNIASRFVQTLPSGKTVNNDKAIPNQKATESCPSLLSTKDVSERGVVVSGDQNDASRSPQELIPETVSTVKENGTNTAMEEKKTPVADINEKNVDIDMVQLEKNVDIDMVKLDKNVDIDMVKLDVNEKNVDMDMVKLDINEKNVDMDMVKLGNSAVSCSTLYKVSSTPCKVISTPYKCISVNDMDFSLQSSYTSFDGDEDNNSVALDKLVGCKENLSPIIRRKTKRKKWNKIISSSTSKVNNAILETKTNSSIAEDKLSNEKNTIGVSNGKDLAKNTSINIVNTSGTCVISNLIGKIGSTPKREGTDINEDVLLKNILDFKSPGQLLKSDGIFECMNVNVSKKKKLIFGNEDEIKSSKGGSGEGKGKCKNEKLNARNEQNESKCSDNVETNNSNDHDEHGDNELILSLPDSVKSDMLDDFDDSDDLALSKIKGSNSKADVLNVDDVFSPESQKCDKHIKDGNNSDINDNDANSDFDNSENLPLIKIKELSREEEDNLNVDDVFTPESKPCNRTKTKKSKCEVSESRSDATDNKECATGENEDEEENPLDISYRTFIKIYGRRSSRKTDGETKRKCRSPADEWRTRERKRSRQSENNDCTDSVKDTVGKNNLRSKVRSVGSSRHRKCKSRTIDEKQSTFDMLENTKITNSPRLSERLSSSKSSTVDSGPKKRLYSDRTMREIGENVELCMRTKNQDSCTSANRDSLNSSPEMVKKKTYLKLNTKPPRSLQTSVTNFEFDEKSEPSSSILFKSPTRSSKRTLPKAKSSNRHGSQHVKNNSVNSKDKYKSRSKSCSKEGHNVKTLSSGKVRKMNSPYSTNAVFCKKNNSSLSSFDFTGT